MPRDPDDNTSDPMLATPISAQPVAPLRHRADSLVAGSLDLLTLPDVFLKVKDVVEDPDTTARDLARVISADPATTARILRLVNSAFWGFSGRIESVSRAVALLGMFQVHDLVLATAVATTFQRIDPAKVDVAGFWSGSVYRGLAAAALARAGALVDVGRVFTEGLLSDIGHMVLFHKVPELAATAIERAAPQPWTTASIEHQLIGCDHAEVGGALADAWRLPACFGIAIRQQIAPGSGDAHGLEAALLHIGAMLAHGRSDTRIAAACVAQIDPSAWEITGLTPDCLPAVRAEVAANLSATEQLFR
jgi:HD-like signal output (HDOD) protein